MSTYAIVVTITILLLFMLIAYIAYAIKKKRWSALITLLFFGGLNYIGITYSNQVASNYFYLFKVLNIISWIGMVYSGYQIFKK